MKTETRADLHASVTAKIIAQLEQGVRPWARPWKGTGHGVPPIPRRVTGERYQGMNVLLLWGAMDERGWSEPVFMTYRQAEELGAHVRRGEHASQVFYAARITKAVENAETGEREERQIPILKAYYVFNVEQIEGLPARYFRAPPRVGAAADAERIVAADSFFANVGANVVERGDRAFYAPHHDAIVVPPIAAFVDAESFYATLAHEHVHWTGHASRLNRTYGARFGDSAYAFEELVAEIGAAFVSAELGLYAEPREDHASYLASWLRVLNTDKRAIFTAASAAQAATDYLEAAARGAHRVCLGEIARCTVETASWAA